MKTKKIIRSILAVSLIAFLGSCSGDDGTDGMDGVDGIDGMDGINGADGADGQDGADGATGTANVIYSDWIERDFPGAAADSNSQLIGTLNVGEVDYDTDVVLVYGRHPVNALFFEVSQLPFILTTQNEYYGFAVGRGSGFFSIRVEPRTTDGGTNLFTYFDDFRYVIIPGGVSTSGKSSLDYSKMGYEELMAYFNIQE